MGIPVIRVRGIDKSFELSGANQPGRLQALAGVDFDVSHNEFVSIIGPSGCGKTTLLKIIGGLIDPDSGTVVVMGNSINGPGPDRAMVFQEFALLPWRDVIGNVAFGLELASRPKEECQTKAKQAIERVGLKGFEHYFPGQLSGGMKQRVGLARALAVDPEILLMDEPFAAVDVQTRQLLQDDLLRLWQEQQKTVIFVTHSMEEAVILSDRVLVMGPSPTAILDEFIVPLPRPRDDAARASDECVRLTSELWHRLRGLQPGYTLG